ncbi:MAG TPA: riboflavin synthase [Thermoanaerobaculia bacterium]|nr:riboflavin synthase [Thermoanaerobaculia bacterium]
MFTGLIQELGTVIAFHQSENGARIEVQRPSNPEPLIHGESIAVNGVCLTAIPTAEGAFAADLSHETLRLTTLASLEPGRRVNLERALALGERLGGHLVQGHVDTTAALEAIEQRGEFAVYRWAGLQQFEPLIVEKGSIAVDGVSLTVVQPDHGSFSVALIPETLQKTTLGEARVGDRSNIEIDMMAKYAHSFMTHYVSRTSR